MCISEKSIKTINETLVNIPAELSVSQSKRLIVMDRYYSKTKASTFLLVKRLSAPYKNLLKQCFAASDNGYTS